MNLVPATVLEGLDDAALSLDEILAEAAHLLPEQAPLHAFVHHNTLHAFEHMPFEQAVVAAAEQLGTEPYQSEAAFATHFASGRITAADIDAVVTEDTRDHSSLVCAGGPTRLEFRRQRLRHLFDRPGAAAIEWMLDESEMLTRIDKGVPVTRVATLSSQLAALVAGSSSVGSGGDVHGLRALWNRLLEAAPSRPTAQADAVRRRDQLERAIGVDTDAVVHPLLIRVCAAFLDQGVAYWSMPAREHGFLAAFRRLYGLLLASPDRGFRGLARRLAQQERDQWNAETTIRWALTKLEHPPRLWPAVIRATLLSLRGWAGMMRHLELRPDHAPTVAPNATLIDYLAVQLVLDAVAAENTLCESSLSGFEALTERVQELAQASLDLDLELVYEAFVLAQRLAVDVSVFSERESAHAWLRAVKEFDELERRRLMHLAFERRHRITVLDGLAARHRMAQPEIPAPAFQAVFCIDEREESLRRHLEETFPAVDTYGYAGFFGVAMEYQGLDDVKPRPLCPVVVRPKHRVVETVRDTAAEQPYRVRRRRWAAFSHGWSVGSKTLTRGGLLSAGVGMIAVVPLVLRSLFPRAAEHWLHAVGHRVAPPPSTKLDLERPCGESLEQDGVLVGYSVDEMAAIVGGALRTMGLTRNFARLVVIVGHGSASLNNPHEAAHDCGATGGGRGGPNARAFAAMANHPQVRTRLVSDGLLLTEDTVFIGAYHNTCDDSMTYYDLGVVPPGHRADVAVMQQAMAVACRWDAHERCRRFESAPVDLSFEHALEHAQVHANDLAQPRPEYGHATNAVCIVGRRSRTRGLFLDRRAFLVSYDPTQDPSGSVLTSLLLAVGPVGAGINLEYYFSYVDPVGFGCGTKLPHNITGLLGVMDGHASDLRTGLPWQMVEIHEPVRLLTVVEAEPETLEAMLGREPSLARLILNGWIQVVAWSPSTGDLYEFRGGKFWPHVAESQVPIVASSRDHYAGIRSHLNPALIVGPTPRSTDA